MLLKIRDAQEDATGLIGLQVACVPSSTRL